MAIGVITLLFGGGYAVFGGWLIFGSVPVVAGPGSTTGFWGPILEALAVIVIVVGAVFLLQAQGLLLGGIGILCRRHWGRNLTCTMAVLTFFWGLIFLRFAHFDATLFVGGASQIVYGILAPVILIKNADFSRPNPRQDDPDASAIHAKK
jgi:hypothetical protein